MGNKLTVARSSIITDGVCLEGEIDGNPCSVVYYEDNRQLHLHDNFTNVVTPMIDYDFANFSQMSIKTYAIRKAQALLGKDGRLVDVFAEEEERRATASYERAQLQ